MADNCPPDWDYIYISTPTAFSKWTPKHLSFFHLVLSWLAPYAFSFPFSPSCSVRGTAYLDVISQRTTGDTENPNDGFYNIWPSVSVKSTFKLVIPSHANSHSQFLPVLIHFLSSTMWAPLPLGPPILSQIFMWWTDFQLLWTELQDLLLCMWQSCSW